MHARSGHDGPIKWEFALAVKEKQRCSFCNGKQRWYSGTQSPKGHLLLSISKGERSTGNSSPSFEFRKAVWPLCWNLNVKHLFLQHSGKGYIISTCEDREDRGRSGSPRVMHRELCGCRCFSGDLWKELHWVHGCILSLKKVSRICKAYHDITKPRIGDGFDHQAHWKPKQTTWPTFSLAFEHPGWFSCVFWKKYLEWQDVQLHCLSGLSQSPWFSCIQVSFWSGCSTVSVPMEMLLWTSRR